MGALTLIRDDIADESLMRRLEANLERQGLGQPVRLTAGGHTILINRKVVAPVANHCVAEDGTFVASAGTLFYRGQHGKPALDRLLADACRGSVDDTAFEGCFVALTGVHGGLRLFTDRLGTAKLYRTSTGEIWSTSFLICLETLDDRRFNPQGVYEYVFQGTTYGRETIVSGIEQAEPDVVHGLTGSEFSSDDRAWPFVLREEPGSLPDQVARVSQDLRQIYGRITDAYGERIDTALSGGYDSRLSLALLRNRGVTPALHVYGQAGDPDVAVAQDVAGGEGLNLEHVDKTAGETQSPEAVAAGTAAQFWAFDGWPTDGIVGTGRDLATRKDRVSAGRLALNGGGGEVFRNFFYLRNRSFKARDILWVFYSQFDPGVTTDLFSESTYLSRLGEKLVAIFPKPHRRLSRTEVEFIYPGFRGRFWTGRNTWLNNRFGPALTPFFEVSVVRAALTVPLGYKNHGRFEAALINRIDPKLAAYPSVYGHNFVDAPSFRHRMGDWATYLRPPWLRKLSYRIKNRIRSAEIPEIMEPEYSRFYLPDGIQAMSRFFKIDSLREAEQRNRVLTLEYLAQEMDVSAR